MTARRPSLRSSAPHLRSLIAPPRRPLAGSEQRIATGLGLRLVGALLVGVALLGASAPADAQCLGNLLSNSSFESHTGGTNSIGDPIPTVWVLESGENGATTAFNPPAGSYIGYVWGTPSSSPGVMSQQVSASARRRPTRWASGSGSASSTVTPTSTLIAFR